MKNRSMNFALGLFLAMLLLPACGSSTPTPGSTSVDVRFREFYDLQGGIELLGKPISEAFNRDGFQYQVFESGIMVFKPSEPHGEQFNFLPLATKFIKEDSINNELEKTGQRFVGGHIIYDEFVATFDRLGGLRFVGRPISEVRKNDEESRYEQYFEKLGFYRMFSDPPGTVRLLPYGQMECHRDPGLGCNGDFPNAIPHVIPPQPFLSTVQRLGEILTGKPLSQVYLAPDNKLEQIYENIVLVFDPDRPRMIEFRPVPELVDIEKQPAVLPRSDPGLSFWQTADGLGYNVPIAFLEFIAKHGGTELSGDPITELMVINGLRRQCFTNYCLEYNPDAPKEQQIRPAALGYEYSRRNGFSMPELQLRIWENMAVIEPGKPQIVGVLVYNKTPDWPLYDVQPVLTVNLDGKTPEKFIFPPTLQSGVSFLEIPAGKIKGLIEYEVCVSWVGTDPICAKDSWIVK